jgi:DNA-binding phage protein
MGTETSPLDTADHLDCREAILGYLEGVFEDGDPDLIAAALNNVVRARGLAQDASSAQSDIASVIRTLKALGLELAAKAACPLRASQTSRRPPPSSLASCHAHRKG